MAPIYECNMKKPAYRPQWPQSPGECTCDAACEPHIHGKRDILCLHDGETDHGHCPNDQEAK